MSRTFKNKKNIIETTQRLPGFRNSVGLTIPSKAVVDSDKISCLGREGGSVSGI